MSTLTTKEAAVLKLLHDKIGRDGIVPSIREIGAQLGFKSTSTVHRCLAGLEEKAYISREKSLNRAIRLSVPRTGHVPLVGTVTAGQPILAIEAIESSIPRAGEADGLFALRVKGESMINAGIFDGDLIIVRSGATAQDGEIVVAMIDDEATVKRFFHEGKGFRLQPENDAMQPILTDHVVVLGKVIELRRDFP